MIFLIQFLVYCNDNNIFCKRGAGGVGRMGEAEHFSGGELLPLKYLRKNPGHQFQTF